MQQALRRELREELGLRDCLVGNYLGKIAHRWVDSEGSQQCTHHFFYVTAPDLPADETPPPCLLDGIAFEWLTLGGEKMPLLKPPSLPDCLKCLLSQHGSRWNLIDDELV